MTLKYGGDHAMKDRILEENVEAIRVVKEIQRNIEEDYDIQSSFEYLMGHFASCYRCSYFCHKK